MTPEQADDKAATEAALRARAEAVASQAAELGMSPEEYLEWLRTR